MGSLIKMLVTAIYLIMLGNTADGQLCSTPVNNIPLFGDQDPRVSLPFDRLQVIIPAYTFTCHGRVVQWGACVERGGGGERYNIDFQVLRPSPVSDPGVDCYSLVGSNFVDNGQPVDRCIVYDVPEGEEVLVQPGDVVGFFSDHVDQDSGESGVQVVESRQDVTVHYRVRDDLPAITPGSCMFAVGPGQIDLVTTGAPVITAVVDASPIPQFCSSPPVANIPVFQDQTFLIIPADQIQVIIPAYTFTCHGRVVQWGACVERGGGGEMYDIYFQVLRPSDSGSDRYTLVGSNFIGNGQPVGSCIVYDVPEGEQVLVQPGDVVGFFSDHVTRTDDNGVQVVEERQDVTAHYRQFNSVPATDPGSMFTVGPGEIDSSTVGAPVITAVVEILNPTISQVVAFSPAAVPFTSMVLPPSPPAVVAPPPVVPPGVASSPTPPVNGIGGASVPVVQGSLPTASQPPTPPNTGSSVVAIIAGTVTGSSIFILLIIIGAILICIRQRSQKSLFKTRMTTSERSATVIVTERNEAYMTNTDVERSVIVTERNEAYMTNTNVERSVIVAKRNEAYMTNADVIPSARNEAYGVVGLEAMNSSNKEDTTDCTYETSHLSEEPPCDEYDYVN